MKLLRIWFAVFLAVVIIASTIFIFTYSLRFDNLRISMLLFYNVRSGDSVMLTGGAEFEKLCSMLQNSKFSRYLFRQPFDNCEYRVTVIEAGARQDSHHVSIYSKDMLQSGKYCYRIKQPFDLMLLASLFW